MAQLPLPQSKICPNTTCPAEHEEDGRLKKKKDKRNLIMAHGNLHL
jgi:hypothetical protein